MTPKDELRAAYLQRRRDLSDEERQSAAKAAGVLFANFKLFKAVAKDERPFGDPPYGPRQTGLLKPGTVCERHQRDFGYGIRYDDFGQ